MLHVNKSFLFFILGLIIIGSFTYFSRFQVLWSISDEDDNVKNRQCLAKEDTIVVKVIDGDTIIVEGGYHVRLLGIDTDERYDICYMQAKIRLEELILGKQVRLEKDISDIDKYDRCLRNVFFGDANINTAMVKEGLAVAAFYGPDVKYKDEIIDAEEYAIRHKVGCKWKQ